MLSVKGVKLTTSKINRALKITTKNTTKNIQGKGAGVTPYNTAANNLLKQGFLKTTDPTKKKITGKKISPQSGKGKTPAVQTAASALTQIKDRFAALKNVRAQLASMKQLYAKHNELMEELMPLFIETTADEFIIKREIKIGSKKYRFTPFFYDEKKSHVVAKVWKSTAFESGAIE